MFRYLLLAEVLEIWVVEVHEGVPEDSCKHGPYLKSFLFKIAHAIWIKVDICLDVYYLLRSFKVGVARLMRIGSDQHETILKQFLIQNCT